MAGFQSSSVWIKIALIGLCLASVLFVVAFATLTWMTYGIQYSESDYGLWKVKICDGRACDEAPVSNLWLIRRGYKDWYRATQVMECFGLICMLVGLIVLFLFVFMDSCRRRNALISIIVLIFAAVGFVAIGIVVFATKFETRGAMIGWSMGLAIASAIFAFISGIMCVLELNK